MFSGSFLVTNSKPQVTVAEAIFLIVLQKVFPLSFPANQLILAYQRWQGFLISQSLEYCIHTDLENEHKKKGVVAFQSIG